MVTDEQTPRLRASRLAHVGELVAVVRDKVGAGHFRGRDVFHELWHRLRLVHDTCEQVDEKAWTEYVVRLDRGLDALAYELARVSEAPSADTVLHVHATRLEIEGWALRLDHARDGVRHAQLTTRRLVERAERNLGEYQLGRTTRDDLDRIMDEVRDTARVQQ
ncbi:hypothetical protein [Pseudonocardia humida]|uniref:Uncharacterized protein n=1 Tax=Pseudonocardia humida TaxID=2800819 RepID=A0ABT1AC12_9PSEU|nr:hypothetical protein [Pseudonocardia humida]MCO1660533.1 hypothetical protein [Pseudonocardia humida]